MKKQCFILVLIAFITCQSKCQDFQINWQNCFGGTDIDRVYDIVEHIDGGYFILGQTESNDGDISFNHGSDDVWLVRIDIYGTLLWEKTLGGTSWDGGRNILEMSDGTYCVLAVSNSSDGDISFDPYPTSGDYWIIKIDSNGNIIWDKIYGGNWFDSIENGIPTNDGGLVAFGFTGSDDGDVSEYFGFYDWWMLKLDSLGNKQWDRSFGCSNSDYGYDVMQTSDGGYLLGGDIWKENNGNIDCNNFHDKADAVIIKLDSNGNVEWQQCYGGAENEYFSDILEENEGYILLGSTRSNDGDVNGLHGLAGLESDIWLVKVDFGGNILWQKCLGGTKSESAKKIFPSEGGGYQIVGSTKSNDGDVSGNHSIGEDIWIIETDSAGNLLKQQCIGGVGNEIVWHGVHKHNDHRFTIACETDYGPSYDVECDIAQFDWGTYWVFEISDSTVGVPDIKQNEEEIIIYPNPADREINIHISDNRYKLEGSGVINHASNAMLTIYDIYGRKISSRKMVSGTCKVDVSGFSPGVYFAVLSNSNSFMSRQKFIIR